MCCWLYILEPLWPIPRLRQCVILTVLGAMGFGAMVLTTNQFIDKCCCYQQDDWSSKASLCGECTVCGAEIRAASSEDDASDLPPLYCQEKHDWGFECATLVETILFVGFFVAGVTFCGASAYVFNKKPLCTQEGRNNPREGVGGGDQGGNGGEGCDD